jgi:hypothetical protein
MDVEGAEPRVVAGGATLFERDRPLILAELHNPQLRAVSDCSATDFIAQMATLRYRCVGLRDGRPSEPLNSYNEDRPINVVFQPL